MCPDLDFINILTNYNEYLKVSKNHFKNKWLNIFIKKNDYSGSNEKKDLDISRKISEIEDQLSVYIKSAQEQFRNKNLALKSSCNTSKPITLARSSKTKKINTIALIHDKTEHDLSRLCISYCGHNPSLKMLNINDNGAVINHDSSLIPITVMCADDYGYVWLGKENGDIVKCKHIFRDNIHKETSHPIPIT